MQIHIYDSVWRLERRIHSIGDLILPVQPTLLVAGTFLASMTGWILLLHTLGLPWRSGWPEIVYLAPPTLLSWGIGKPVADGKTVPQWARSQVRFLLEPTGPQAGSDRLVSHVRRGRR